MNNFQSQLTLKIEAEKKMLLEHQQTLQRFQQQNLIEFTNIEMNLKNLEKNVASTTANIMQLSNLLTEKLQSNVAQSSEFQQFLLQQLQEIAQLKTQLKDQEHQISSLQESFLSAQTQQKEQNITTSNDLKNNQKSVNILKKEVDTKWETVLHNLQVLQAHSIELMEQQQQLQRRIQIALVVLILALFAIYLFIF